MDDGGTYRFRFTTARGQHGGRGAAHPDGGRAGRLPHRPHHRAGGRAGGDGRRRGARRVAAEDDYGLDRAHAGAARPGRRRERRARCAPSPACAATRAASTCRSGRSGSARGSGSSTGSRWRTTTPSPGPKKGASATQAVQALQRGRAPARRHGEGPRRLGAAASPTSATGSSLRGRRPGGHAGAAPARRRARRSKARALHQAVAARRRPSSGSDPVAPREVVQALANVAASLRTAEQRATAVRQARSGRWRPRQPVGGQAGQVAGPTGCWWPSWRRTSSTWSSSSTRPGPASWCGWPELSAAQARPAGGAGAAPRRRPARPPARRRWPSSGGCASACEELQARMAETARGFNDQHLNAEAMAELLGRRTWPRRSTPSRRPSAGATWPPP